MFGISAKYNGFFPQLAAVLAATLNAVSDGMNYGWSSPMGKRLLQGDFPIQATEFDINWLENTLLLAGLIGLPIIIYLVDKIGRKSSTLVASVTSVIGWTIVAFADHIAYLYVARFLMGIAADIAFISSPMYIAEIACPQYRGFLSGLIYVMSFTGVLLIYVIGPFVDFYVPSVIAVSVLLVQLLTLPFMPESPYFLAKKNKKDKAEKALFILRGTPNVTEEMNAILTQIENQKNEKKGTVLELFTVKSNLKAVIIMGVLNFGQHFAGYTAITMNLALIMDNAQANYFTEEVNGMLYSACMLISSLLATLFVDKLGRKVILIISAVFSGISLLVTGYYFEYKTTNDVSSITWIPLVSVMCFAFFFKFGLGIIPIVLTAELFPPQIKAKGMASGDANFIIAGALSNSIFFMLKNTFEGLYVPFYFFAASAFATGIFSAVYIPETKGKTLEEIILMLKG